MTSFTNFIFLSLWLTLLTTISFSHTQDNKDDDPLHSWRAKPSKLTTHRKVHFSAVTTPPPPPKAMPTIYVIPKLTHPQEATRTKTFYPKGTPQSSQTQEAMPTTTTFYPKQTRPSQPIQDFPTRVFHPKPTKQPSQTDMPKTMFYPKPTPPPENPVPTTIFSPTEEEQTPPPPLEEKPMPTTIFSPTKSYFEDECFPQPSDTNHA